MSEFKLESDGTISGPNRSKDGRRLITHSLFVENHLPKEEVIALFDNYFKLALKAIIKITENTITPNTAWNVAVQSVPFMHNNEIGTLYCTLAEVGDPINA